MQQSMWLVVIMFSLFVVHPAHAAEQSIKDFTLPSATDGALIRLADHAGKVVLINWWRTSCPWSQKESPRLVGLYKKYRDQGLVILGVFDKLSEEGYETVDQIPAYLKRYGIAWPIGLNDQGEFMREIRPLGTGETPENYLVSRSGKVVYLGLDRSEASWQKLEAAVVRALAEPRPATVAIQPRERRLAPAFSLPDLQDKTVHLADFAGKPLIVNFFTAENCDWAGAVLAKLHGEYSGRGVQFVGINLYDDNAAIQRCMTKHGVKYPVLRGNEATQKAWIGSSSGWATFFVTADGKVAKKIADSIENGLEGPVFAKYAESLLGKKQ